MQNSVSVRCSKMGLNSLHALYSLRRRGRGRERGGAMNRLLSCLVAVSAIAAVSGCATDDVTTGASVTRFHLGQPIARGPIAIEAADPRDTNGLEFSQISASIAREQTRLGWTVVPRNASEQVAMVRL